MFSALKKILKHAFGHFEHQDYKSLVVAKHPADEKFKNGIIYLVGERNFYKWALMKCPCGCGETVTMSLMRKHEPNWTVRHDRYKRISLTPSVWKADGCRSHYFIKKGKLIWVSEWDDVKY